jgi:2-C-methyl-D-erythritol 4-phosphate cytidylyltransferase
LEQRAGRFASGPFFFVHTTAILVAAGPGTRLGGDRPKGFVPLAGVPLFIRSLRALLAADAVDSAIVVVPPGWSAEAAAVIERDGPWRRPLEVVEGGAERQDSVRAGLAATEDADLVAVHDAARPFVSASAINTVIRAAAEHGAAILAVRSPDTVKRVGGDGYVVETVERAGLWLAQTPQAFGAELLRTAHDGALAERIVATDDAALVERLGLPVHVVEGESTNRKITTADDLRWAEWFLTVRPEPR